MAVVARGWLGAFHIPRLANGGKMSRLSCGGASDAKYLEPHTPMFIMALHMYYVLLS